MRLEDRGLLLGPFVTHAEALERVEDAKRIAYRIDPDAHRYRYGTTRVEASKLPTGRLNNIAARERAA